MKEANHDQLFWHEKDKHFWATLGNVANTVMSAVWGNTDTNTNMNTNSNSNREKDKKKSEVDIIISKAKKVQYGPGFVLTFNSKHKGLKML